MNFSTGNVGSRTKVFRILRFCLILVLAFPVWLLLALTILATLFGEDGRNYELLTHLRAQFSVALVGLIAILAVMRAQPVLVPAIVALVFNLWDIVPLYFSMDPSSASASANSKAQPTNFKLLSINVNTWNKEFDAISKMITSSDADVVCVQELTPALSEYLLPRLKSTYPFSFVVPQEGMFGIGILSKVELADKEALKLCADKDIPTQRATIKVGRRSIVLLNTHTMAPLDEPRYGLRNEQLEQLAEITSKSRDPIILVGDLNLTPYSPFFKRLIDKGDLTDSERGFGVQPTWFAAGYPFGTSIDHPLFKIPLDHVLLRGPIGTVNREILGAFGSDHNPLLVELSVTDN